MSTLIEADNCLTNGDAVAVTSGIGTRTAVLIYSIVSYVVGMTGLMWLILAVGGLLPYGFSPVHTDSPVMAVLMNLGLVFLFGLQHTIMARRKFKQKLSRLIPVAAERATFVFASGVVMGIAVWCWQTVPGTVWSIETTAARVVLWGLYLAGWSYLVLSTIITNHFELFGLRQALLFFRGIPYEPVRFTKKWMYAYSRHPMMLGVLVGLWAVPDMSITHFILALFLSGYIVIGMLFEERSLIDQFGDTYREYKRNIGTFFTVSK